MTKKKPIPCAVGIVRQPTFESAIVVTDGFEFSDPQKDELRATGATVLSLAEALSSGQLKAEYIAVSRSLTDTEKNEIRKLVKNSGTLSLSSNGANVVSLVVDRVKQRRKEKIFIPPDLA